MKVKGTAVKTIPEFIQKNHPGKYKAWAANLPEVSRNIFHNGIKASDWYPVDEAIVIPIKIMEEMFYSNNRRGAWESGRYSADVALSGIYKLYVRISSPGHIIERASRVLQAYYEPSDLRIISSGKNFVNLHILKFEKFDEVIDHRLAGWMERALEISGCRNINIDIPKSFSKGDPYTEFRLTWE
jgi:hypothetical protein